MTSTPSMGSVLPQSSYNQSLILFTINNTWTAARCQITSPCTTDLITCGRPASRLRYKLSHHYTHTHTRHDHQRLFDGGHVLLDRQAWLIASAIALVAS